MNFPPMSLSPDCTVVDDVKHRHVHLHLSHKSMPHRDSQLHVGLYYPSSWQLDQRRERQIEVVVQ